MTELCIKCGREPRYRYSHKVGTAVYCAKCCLLVLADFMSELIPGDTEADREATKKTVEWLRGIANEAA